MMSRTSSEGEEDFYESLDRILSSSCSSTSASDDDTEPHGRRHHHLPRFPPASAASLDVWLAEPAPVEERRLRLLLQMGLASDPALSRRRLADDSAGYRRAWMADMNRSVSCDGLCPRPQPFSSAIIARSRSDGSVDPASVNNEQPESLQPSDPSPGLPTASKPPLVGRSRPSSGGNIELSDVEGVAVEDEERRCTIRNLDTGREFVVKEFREDGMWNKLREVGTGRQLTMEEFEMCVGRSPIVQELMRRQNVEDSGNGGSPGGQPRTGTNGVIRPKKRGSWLRSIKNVAGTVVGGGYHRDRRSGDERDTSSEKGGRRSSSATDDSQEGPHPLHDCPQRTKVRQYGKSHKELTCLYLSQEIQAHSGAIWSIKFSLDGRYLASAGEDCIIHVWQVSEKERKGELLAERASEDNGSSNLFAAAICNGSPEPAVALSCVEGGHWEKKRRAKVPGGRKSVSSDQLMVPEHLFALSDSPVCTLKGHLDDVLDLSWSKSEEMEGNVCCHSARKYSCP